ncbi:hypothetical protein [Microbacterium aurum]
MRDVAGRAVVQRQPGTALDERATAEAAGGLHHESRDRGRAGADDRRHLDRIAALEATEGHGHTRAGGEVADSVGQQILT